MIARASMAWLVCLVLAAPVLAADPPVTVNYQGVLRDLQNKPLSGGYNMTFRFFDDESFGNELLVDTHTGGLAVTVANGVFNVALGGGVVSDGAGPGTYASLADVFSGNANVWLQITVGIDTLFPRIRIRSSAYALNAATLQGRPAASFLDTSSTAQTKDGALFIRSSDTVPLMVSDTVTGVFQMFGDPNLGISIQGSPVGGVFNSTAGSYAVIANYAEGVQIHGATTGGVFSSFNGAGLAYLAKTDIGIDAYGRFPSPAGHFDDIAYTGDASLGWGDTGIVAKGSYAAGEFDDPVTGRQAFLASNAFNSAGYFTSATVWTALVDLYGYGLATNGLKDFIQNHPSNRDRVIAYTALEGPEAGTYTRGSGVLHGGEARVTLDPSFALTTDPDIGLTAMVTPRGAVSLYVASVSTRELVVRSSAPLEGDLSFDYTVNGLRLGFENHPTILPAAAFPSATVPALEAAAERLAAQPEDVRASTPLARFTANRGADGHAPDLKRARELVAGINAPDHAGRSVPAPAVQPAREPAVPARPAVTTPATGPAPAATVPPGPAPAAEPPAPPAFVYTAPVQGTVEAGSVLSNDPSSPGTLRLADVAGDPGVIGVVAGPAGASFSGTATIAPAGTIVWCRVDATERPIALNDLLVASTNPGYAMSAGAEARQGTVLGKALEPLPAGTGSIRILVMSR